MQPNDLRNAPLAETTSQTATLFKLSTLDFLRVELLKAQGVYYYYLVHRHLLLPNLRSQRIPSPTVLKPKKVRGGIETAAGAVTWDAS